MLSFGLLSLAAAASAYVVIDPNHIPAHAEPGMYGTNHCGHKDSKSSKCQTAWVNGPTDFCFFSGPRRQPVGDFESYAVTYCTAAHHGARLVPKGTFHNIHYVETPDYIQITAVGDFTKVNIPKGDEGGELDPHGADGRGNPVGGIIVGKPYGKLEQFDNWTEFISDTEFCLRICRRGPNSLRNCQHIYDVMGCRWNIPGDYDSSGFDSCKGNTIKYPMGVYPVKGGGLSTFHQGEAFTPSGQMPAHTSKCSRFPAPSPKYAAVKKSNKKVAVKAAAEEAKPTIA